MLGPTATATVDVIGGWHLSLPALSSGGKFFNVYRKGPRDRDLAFLVSLDSAAVGFDDDGSIDADPLHRAPVNNTTNVTSSVSVALPATHVPAGTSWTWRIYRTYDPTEWDRSLLVWNGPTPSFVDDGRELLPGYPPEASGAVGGAPRIDIVAETTGSLPPDMVSATKLVNFTADRPQVGEGNWHWINEYRQAALVSLRAALGRGSPAQSGEVRIGIDRCDEGGSWVQLTNQSAQPIYCTIPQGQTMSSPVSLTTALPADALTPGDRLRLRVIQVAADETSARDLNVTVTMLVRDGTPGKTYVWKTT
jgi:hypothetical protein